MLSGLDRMQIGLRAATRQPNAVQRSQQSSQKQCTYYKKGGSVSRETDPLNKRPLILAAGSEDIHDAVQVLNAGELNADPSLAYTKRDLNVCVQAVGQ